jgi:hypothetical protein
LALPQLTGREPPRFDLSQETVASAWNGFNVSWFMGIIAQSDAYLIDGEVDPALEVDEGVVR